MFLKSKQRELEKIAKLRQGLLQGLDGVEEKDYLKTKRGYVHIENFFGLDNPPTLIGRERCKYVEDFARFKKPPKCIIKMTTQNIGVTLSLLLNKAQCSLRAGEGPHSYLEHRQNIILILDYIELACDHMLDDLDQNDGEP